MARDSCSPGRRMATRWPSSSRHIPDSRHRPARLPTCPRRNAELPRRPSPRFGSGHGSDRGRLTMFILYALILGLLVGTLSRGRLDGVAELKYYWPRVMLAGLLIQVILFSDQVTTWIG